MNHKVALDVLAYRADFRSFLANAAHSLTRGRRYNYIYIYFFPSYRFYYLLFYSIVFYITTDYSGIRIYEFMNIASLFVNIRCDNYLYSKVFKIILGDSYTRE